LEIQATKIEKHLEVPELKKLLKNQDLKIRKVDRKNLEQPRPAYIKPGGQWSRSAVGGMVQPRSLLIDPVAKTTTRKNYREFSKKTQMFCLPSKKWSCITNFTKMWLKLLPKRETTTRKDELLLCDFRWNSET
jgi:hypothetical protein